MLRETVKGWTEDWLRQGEGQMLARQLERKFGPLSARTRRRIDRADAETLLTWGERVLTARSLAEVFGD